MHRTPALAALITAGMLAAAPPTGPKPFSGEAALSFTRVAVGLGPRPSGSTSIRKLQTYILAELRKTGCEVIQDDFTAQTPAGPTAMKNIIARFPGSSGRAVVIAGHYDTKAMPGTYFVGANDGGSSTGFLLEMARAVASRKFRNDIYLVWFDGEEAVGRWSATNGTFGSRHLAQRWSAEGVAAKIIALINVDMIGDLNLELRQEVNSSRRLTALIWQVARELGYERHFLNESSAVEDDHIPFLQLGINAVDLIDFDYGPDNSWWHTERDTIDKLSTNSFRVVGDVVLEAIRRLE